MKKITVLDIFIVSVIVLLVLVTISYKALSYFNGKNNSSASLLILTNEDEYVYSLNQDRTVKIKGKNGYTIIEIKDGKFRFKDSECLNKDCVKMGWVSIKDYPVICLPNQVTAYIIYDFDKNEFDGISQ